MSRPNARLERVGDELAHVHAPKVTAALEHIAHELTIADSISDHTPGAAPATPLPYLEKRPCGTCRGRGWSVVGNTPTPCDDCDARGTIKLTPTERAAVKRYELTAGREDIRDLVASFEQLRDSLRTVCDKVMRTRMPEPVTEKGTCYADALLPGYYEPLVEGGWFDPTCHRISRTVKPGLCDACRKRLERYNDAHGLKPPKDERIVKYDSIVRMDEDGVARAREVR